MEMVCPQCGHNEFTQPRMVPAIATITVSSDGTLNVEHVEVEGDGSGDWDDAQITCSDCGASYFPDADELITREVYALGEDD